MYVCIYILHFKTSRNNIIKHNSFVQSRMLKYTYINIHTISSNNCLRNFIIYVQSPIQYKFFNFIVFDITERSNDFIHNFEKGNTKNVVSAQKNRRVHISHRVLVEL